MKNKNINTSVTTKPPVEAASAEHIESADSNFAQTQRRKKKRDLRKKDWAILKRFISYSLQYKKTLILAILAVHSSAILFFLPDSFHFGRSACLEYILRGKRQL